MKIDRLIGINKKAVTVPYFTEKFEVSHRIITRDMEGICKAGIPIVTTQGAKIYASTPHFQKGIVHCSACPDIPCGLLTQDSCNSARGDVPHGARIAECKRWAKYDT